MKSETRANWIFLAIFMLIMGPGLIILTRKAYKKGAAGMNPPAPKTVVAYNNPNPQNPMLPRVVPPETNAFVESIAYRLLKLQPELKRVKLPDGKPIMSEKLSLECIAIGAGTRNYYVGLVGWDRNLAPLPSIYDFVARREGEDVPAKMAAYEQLNMPIDARSELQQHGYFLPPDSVMWIVLEIPGTGPIDSLSLRYNMPQKAFEDHLNLTPTTLPSTQTVGETSQVDAK